MILVSLSVGFNVIDLFVFIEWEMFRRYFFSFIFLVLIDWVRLGFSGLVLVISGMVVIYSGEYMGQDLNLFRFIIILILFVVSIILIIFRPNIIRILLGWDGLGLVSYCLVIYYQNIKSLNAGLLTILSNRVGDIAILLRIRWLFNFGVWNFFLLEYMYKGDLFFITLLMVLAAITKSAQIPFSAWLPAAIAAPTPISALVHSSTLVTAGVYLIIRFRELLGVREILFYLSVLTILMSGFGANFEIDIKRIIALSTLRQLGVMIISLSLGLVELAFFHLLMHALFKSLLFLCAGVYIHGFGDKQDVRSLGGVIECAPLTSFYFIGCSLALCGFPFIRGFYSKDLILEMLIIRNLNWPQLSLVILSTAFTVSYSLRLFLLIVIKCGYLGLAISSIEGWDRLSPMSVLFVFAVVRGAIIG
jgi:NADH-ubiquinone oxidoreductase chain 5